MAKKKLPKVLALLDVAEWQFGQHVAQFMHRAATTLSVRPDLLDGRDQAWCTVGDYQPRTAQATSREISTEVDPVLA